MAEPDVPGPIFLPLLCVSTPFRNTFWLLLLCFHLHLSLPGRFSLLPLYLVLWSLSGPSCFSPLHTMGEGQNPELKSQRSVTVLGWSLVVSEERLASPFLSVLYNFVRSQVWGKAGLVARRKLQKTLASHLHLIRSLPFPDGAPLPTLLKERGCSSFCPSQACQRPLSFLPHLPDHSSSFLSDASSSCWSPIPHAV